MIRNLNQVTFQQFGSVPSERTQNAKNIDKSVIKSWPLEQKDLGVYRAKTEVFLNCGTGMAVLDVSVDGIHFYHYYLDKPVFINEGIIFLVAPFQGDASVLYYAKENPEKLGLQPLGNLRVDSKLKVDGIYTFFYQEKEQGFLFSGESHPMAELTYVDQGACILWRMVRIIC